MQLHLNIVLVPFHTLIFLMIAALPVDDSIPEERVISYNEDDPEIKLGALFLSMVKFGLAVRQWVINKELELHIAKTDPNRYDGYCKGSDDCPWHIHARPEISGNCVQKYAHLYI